jgi:pilus assembly protein CpaC
MWNRCFRVLLPVVVWAGIGGPLSAQAQSPAADDAVINVPVGNSFVVNHPSELVRVMITNTEVADAVPVSLSEVVINGLSPGTTTLLFWDERGTRHSYSVRVTADVGTIQSEIDRIIPGNGVTVTAVGNSIILSGEVSDPRTAERAVSLAEALGGGSGILNYIAQPDPGQVMLQVRVAEVSRSQVERMGINLLRVGTNEGFLQTGAMASPTGAFPASPSQTFSDAVNFYLFHDASGIATFIRALQEEGVFRSLAEPNLITVPGETASFLAGGEFPYPMVQPQTGQVSVQFREFGIQLNFTPTITNAGAIRLEVEPEVSSLDFASGVTVAGTLVPALLSRRAATVVELEAGQTFAIAGLMDNEMTESINKVPLLGDIPVLGAFFRSTEARENKTELLVLVTPQFVRPADQMPQIPPGEDEIWPWSDFMQRPLRIAPPAGANGGGL